MSSNGLFLGNDLLAYVVLAVGGALVVGNVLALVRPPAEAKAGDLRKAPLSRTMIQVAVGAVATLWALASLLSK